MKSITISCLERIVGCRRGGIHYFLKKRNKVGSFKCSGKRYVYIDYAKQIAQEMIIFSNRKLPDVLNDLDNF